LDCFFQKWFSLLVAISVLFGGTAAKASSNKDDNENSQTLITETAMVKKIVKSEKEWKKILAPDEYRVLRKRRPGESLHRQIQRPLRKGYLYLRCLRDAAVQLGNQVRPRHRLAAFHGTCG
jgi:peptide methionine sulfoxide reductase msrA/msrB